MHHDAAKRVHSELPAAQAGPRHVKDPKLNPEAGYAVRHLPPADEEDKPVGRACAERVEVPASCYFYRYF